MNIELTDTGLILTPENQAEYFQLEILWNNCGENLKIDKKRKHGSHFLECLEIKVERHDQNIEQKEHPE